MSSVLMQAQGLDTHIKTPSETFRGEDREAQAHIMDAYKAAAEKAARGGDQSLSDRYRRELATMQQFYEGEGK